jgi:hypothetical protein
VTMSPTIGQNKIYTPSQKQWKDSSYQGWSVTLSRRHVSNRFQSAYRCNHSIETALLKIFNDIYSNADHKSRSLLVQLKLSAAFDTIDHSTLQRRLEHSFGQSGTVARWLQSYIKGCSQVLSLYAPAKNRLQPLSASMACHKALF